MARVNETFGTKLSGNWLDVLAGVKTQEEAGAFKKKHASIDWYRVKVEGEAYDYVYYWGFDHYLSETMKDDILQTGNSNLFMNADEVQPRAKIASRRYLRIAHLLGVKELFHMIAHHTGWAR